MSNDAALTFESEILKCNQFIMLQDVLLALRLWIINRFRSLTRSKDDDMIEEHFLRWFYEVVLLNACVCG